MLKHVVLTSVATFYFSAAVWAQTNVVTENLNQTGIPRTAPPLSLGQIYGLNPCATGVTAGVTTPLFGISGAISDIDRECETRNNAAVVITGLKDETMAREILCTIKDVREAAARVGKPCLGDARTVAEAAHTIAERMHTPEVATVPSQPPASPVATANAQPASQTPAPKPANTSAQGAPQAPQQMVVRAGAPAFCHGTGLALYLYPECTGNATNEAPSTAAQRTVSATVRKPEGADATAIHRVRHFALRVPQASPHPVPASVQVQTPAPKENATVAGPCDDRCSAGVAHLRLEAIQLAVVAELRRRELATIDRQKLASR